MLNKDQLQGKADKMLAYLEKKVGSEPNDIIDRLENLNILLTQSGNCLADAKYHQDVIVNGAIMEAVQKAYEEKLSPSVINKFVSTAAKDYNYLVNLFDRINSSAVHQIDSLRSILSYRKSEMVL
jgi:hypothetical protein